MILSGDLSIHDSNAVIEGWLSVGGPLYLGDFSIFANQTKLISGYANDTSGALHGTWTVEVPITTSDRRFKKNIHPLEHLLEGKRSKHTETVSDWVLSQLRPVSFVMTEGDDSVRFGFIAQEIQKIIPELVRTTSGNETTLSVVYQDMLAVLTMILQEQARRIEQLETDKQERNSLITKLERTMLESQNRAKAFEERILALFQNSNTTLTV